MKFDMSEAWREATAMIAANREVLLVVAGLFFFLPSVALGFALGDMQELMLADPEETQKALFEVYSGWWWLFALIVIASIVGYLTLLALLRAHDRPTVGQAIKTALAGLLPAIGTYLLFAVVAILAIAVAGGLARASGSQAVGIVAVLICVVGLLYAAVKTSLAGPVIAIDKVMNPLRVIARSWRLTRGNSLRLFVFYLLLAIAYLVISVVVGIVVAGLILVVGKATGTMVNAVLTGLLSAVVTTIYVAVLAAVHRQLSNPPAAVGLGQTLG